MSTLETLRDDARDEMAAEWAEYQHERHGGNDYPQLAGDCQVCGDAAASHHRGAHDGADAPPDCWVCHRAHEYARRTWGDSIRDPLWIDGEGYLIEPLVNGGAK